MARQVMLSYPNFDHPFYVKPDASKFQLGAVIYQIIDGEEVPIAFYSRKLNSAQRNYTVMEKELLSIVETVVHFRHILLGFKVFILSDHKNLSFENFASERVRRWRLILEEYDYVFKHIPREENEIADFFSKWEMAPLQSGDLEEMNLIEL